MEVDAKTMSLEDLIKKDKGGNRGRGNRGRGGSHARGGARNVQGGRPRFNDKTQRKDNFRAKKTGNMISKDRANKDGRHQKVSGLDLAWYYLISVFGFR